MIQQEVNTNLRLFVLPRPLKLCGLVSRHQFNQNECHRRNTYSLGNHPRSGTGLYALRG